MASKVESESGDGGGGLIHISHPWLPCQTALVSPLVIEMA